MKKVELVVNGNKLRGVLFFPEKLKDKNPSILFIQGWTGKKERSYQYAEGLSKLGFICFLPDLRGHGESDGDRMISTNKDFLEDAMAAYDFLLKANGVDAENINGIGSSFGGFLMACLSSKRKISNLVLRVPADYPDEAFEAPKSQISGKENPEIMDWRRKLKKSTETFALRAINDFMGKVLVIESEFDDSIPNETIENYLNAVKDKNKLTHAFMKGAPHSINEGPFRDEVERILVNWFKMIL